MAGYPYSVTLELDDRPQDANEAGNPLPQSPFHQVELKDDALERATTPLCATPSADQVPDPAFALAFTTSREAIAGCDVAVDNYTASVASIEAHLGQNDLAETSRRKKRNRHGAHNHAQTHK